MVVKKPICIIATYLRSYNYGATLQAYSLDKVLKNIGFDSVYFDMPRSPRIYQMPIRFGSALDTKRSILKLFSLFHINELKRMYDRFDSFVAGNIKTTKVFDDIHDLLVNLPRADCYITGSDQVLTMRIDPLLWKIRLLDFDTNGAMKCSYAASLAEYDLNDSEKIEYGRILGEYRMISVREYKAISYMSGFVKKTMEVHVDPVFLMTCNQWLKTIWNVSIPKPLPERYILVIVVTDNPILNKTIEEIKKIANLPVVCVRTNPLKTVKADRYCFDFGPEEWLYAIANADYVITSSFHGTCFAIIFGKRFSVVIKEKANPTRIIELLERFGLEDRLIQSNRSYLSIRKDIDYFAVKKIIDKERDRSIQYLRSIFSLVDQNADKDRYDEI